MSLNDIHNMPTNEKIELMELLWQSLCIEEKTPPPSPDWHKDILEQRAKNLSKEKLYTLDELKDRR